MASRFEAYVQERVGELAKARRDKLKAALENEQAKIQKKSEKYLKAVEDGVEALIRKTVEQAKKDGCEITEGPAEAEVSLSEYAKGRIRDLLGLEQKYDFNLKDYVWGKSTVARKLQNDLMEFDNFCRKEARRIVVYKMDLGMKPEAFEKMLAEVAEKLKEA